jgi:hypothetical protein
MAKLYIAHSDHELRKAFRLVNGQIEQVNSAGYTRAKEFSYESWEVGSLSDIHTALSKLNELPCAALIIGRPLDDNGPRRSDYFEDDNSPIWLIDLDSVPVEAGSVKQTASQIRACLPFLNGKAFVFAYSQSAGIKPGLRVRVACIAPEMSLTTKRAYARHFNDMLRSRLGGKAPLVDSNIYSLGHLLFSARPDLAGFDDPHPDRIHLVDGADDPVELPDLPRMVEVSDSRGGLPAGSIPRLRTVSEGGRDDAMWRFVVAIRAANPAMGSDEAFEHFRAEQRRLGADDATLREFGHRSFISKFRRAAPGNFASSSRRVLANDAPTVSLDMGERKLKEAITQAFASWALVDGTPTPPVIAIEATAGLGKTQGVIEAIRAWNKRTPFLPLLVDYYTPNHALSDPIAKAAAQYGLSSFVEYGRDQTVDGEPVCHKAEAAKQLQGLDHDLTSLLCENKETGEVCEFRATCRWWKQRDWGIDHDVRVRTHSHLAVEARSSHNHYHRATDLVVIDEDFFQALINTGELIDLGQLLNPTRLHDSAFGLQQKFAQVIRAGLSLESLVAAGLDEAAFEALREAELKLQPPLKITPGLSPNRAAALARAYDTNWHRHASVWDQLRQCVHDGTMNRVRITNDAKWLVLNSRRAMAAIPRDANTGRPNVPVLIISATMKPEIIEQFLPIDKYYTINVEKHPSSKIIQADLKGTKSEAMYGLTPERREKYGETDPAKIEQAASLRNEIVKVAAGRPLFTFKHLEPEVGGAGHFNALQGRNEWSGQAIVVYGRPLPPPCVIEDMARALFCDGPEIASVATSWYPKREVARRGGLGWGYAEYHTDARAEAVRWSICEGAIMQAVARSRYVRQPAEVLILSQTVLPLEIDETRRFEHCTPDFYFYEQAAIRLLSAREYEKVFPYFAGKDSRSIKREFPEYEIRHWARQHYAYPIEYRRGTRGPYNRAFTCTDRPEAILGEVQVRDYLGNDPAIIEHLEWLQDTLAVKLAFEREPWLDDDGEIVGAAPEEQVQYGAVSAYSDELRATNDWAGRWGNPLVPKLRA